MFSEPTTQDHPRHVSFTLRWNLTRALLLGALLALVTTSCGRKEDPRPPSRPIPAAANDLKLLQRGKQIILEFGYPITTTSGRALPGIDSVEVWEYVRPLGPSVPVEATPADGAEEGAAEDSGTDDDPVEPSSPAAATPVLFGGIAQGSGDQDSPGESPFGTSLQTRPESEIQVDAREFEAAAQLKMSLVGSELSGAISGARVFLRFGRGPIESDSPSAHIFAVRTTNGEDLVSPFSNRVVLIPKKTPAPPADLKVVPSSNGVDLSWLQDEKNKNIAGYRIYRRDAQNPHYGDALRTLPSASSSFRDTTPQFGSRYIYTVTAVLEATQPMIESSIGEEFEVHYADRFAPDQPRNLVIFTNSDSVRLLWEQSPDSDVAGYRVLRRGSDNEFQPQHKKLLVETEFVDTKIESGSTYFYQVIAVDQAGNKSEPSEDIETQVP